MRLFRDHATIKRARAKCVFCSSFERLSGLKGQALWALVSVFQEQRRGAGSSFLAFIFITGNRLGRLPAWWRRHAEAICTNAQEPACMSRLQARFNTDKGCLLVLIRRIFALSRQSRAHFSLFSHFVLSLQIPEAYQLRPEATVLLI